MSLRILRTPVAILVAAFATIFYSPALTNGHGWAMDDFRAFYCSGQLLLDGKEVYSAAPLAACERQRAPRPLFTARRAVLPAPLPSYEVAVFAAIALVPFTAAVLLWLSALFVATIASCVLLARLGVGRVSDIVVAFSVIVIGISFVQGEVIPVALAGVALAAWGVRRAASARSAALLVGCGVLLALFEPQIGVAVAIACSVLSWRFALAVAVAVGTVVLVSIGVLGIGGNLAYIRDVLPAHVASELPAYFQYSLSWMLNRLGMAAGPALLIGRLEWVGMLGLTAWFARSRFARARPEIAVIAAPALAVTGGPFLHLDQIALALPAALWLASTRPSVLRTIAVVCLALPAFQLLRMTAWTSRFDVAFLALVGLVTLIAVWLGAVYGRSAAIGLRMGAGALVAFLVVVVTFAVTGFGIVHVGAPLLPSAAPQAAWAQFVAAHYAATAWPVWLAKAPTWFGLGTTAAGLVRAAWGYRTGRVPSGAMQNAT